MSFHTAAVDSGLPASEEMALVGPEEESRIYESFVLLMNEFRYALRYGDEAGRWYEMGRACGLESVKRRAYGEQLKRKLKKW